MEENEHVEKKRTTPLAGRRLRMTLLPEFKMQRPNRLPRALAIASQLQATRRWRKVGEPVRWA